MNATPTNELRFVRRRLDSIGALLANPLTEGHKLILQQKWEIINYQPGENPVRYEWLDAPTVEEV